LISLVKDLPEIETALRALRRRDIRAWVDLLVRLLLLALLRTFLVMRYPALRPWGILLDAMVFLLLLWPLFLQLARNMRWRIALGRHYVEARRWDEARRTLAPLSQERSALLDATGEGTFALALSLENLGEEDAATRLYRRLTSLSSPWGEQARQKIQQLPQKQIG
jgi:hypothetical protein